MAEPWVDIEAGIAAIRETWDSNADYLEDLKERAAEKSAVPLVPFVGAGLSMPMGFLSWSGFLLKLAKECGLTNEIAALLNANQYEEAADAVQTGLSVEIFNDRLAHFFGQRPSSSCTLSSAVLALPGLCHGPVITTNFDRILERVFEHAGKPFTRYVWGAQVDSLRQALADNKPFLLKIHGDAEERAGRVLTRAEFDRHYGTKSKSKSSNDLRAQLRRIFESRTLLFLGCSLDSDRTMEVLLESARAVAGLRHFAVMPRPHEDKKLYERSRWLGEHGIRPIWYPCGKHELIEPLLRWLAAQGVSPAPPGEKPSQPQARIQADPTRLRGSRAIQILISQHFRIADLLINPERVRLSGFAPVLNSGTRMRRALNRKKQFAVGTLGKLRPVATIGGYSDPYWQDSIPDFRTESAEPQVWFFPFELNLDDFLKHDGFTPESMLQDVLGESKDVSNRQMVARLRIYPPGVGVIRLSITLTFRDALAIDLVAKVAQELEDALLPGPTGDQRTFREVLIKIINEVANELFTEHDTTPSGRRWSPPEITYFVHDDSAFAPEENVAALVRLLSLAPENKERPQNIERRLEDRLASQEWKRDGLVALSCMRVALLLVQRSDSELTRRRRRQTVEALLETGELIAAGVYALGALEEKLNKIHTLRTIEDLPKGQMQIDSLARLLAMMKTVLRAIAAAKIDVNRRQIGVLTAFAGATWRHGHLGRQISLLDDLAYVRDWARRQAGDPAADQILRTLAEIGALADPFRRARQEVELQLEDVPA